MGEYKNPVPNLDDKNVSTEFYISFVFEKYVSREEAAKGISRVIAENGGKIPIDWIKFGRKPSTLSAETGKIN